MLLKGWRKTTITQYQAYLKMWSFVQKNIIVMKNITIRIVLNFYLHLFKKKTVDIVQLTLPDQPFHVFSILHSERYLNNQEIYEEYIQQ